MRRGILFVAGSGATDDALASTACRHGLERRVHADGFVLYTGADLAPRRRDDGAIIVGDLFTGSGATGGAWGDYIRFVQTGVGSLIVERAAMTGMPIYWLRAGRNTVGFSHLDLVLAHGLPLAIDWGFVRHCLAYRGLRTARTGLLSLWELLPGTRLQIAGSVSIETLWSPWSFAGAEREPDPPDAAAAVEGSIIAAAEQWTRGKAELLLELSGGLDSSIVAAALAACNRRFASVTVATQGADGDERRYARDAARAAESELIEAIVDESEIDLLAPPPRATPRPGAFSILRGFDRAVSRAVDARRPDAILSGIGGDNVFCFSHSVAPAIDIWKRHGPGSRWLQCIADIARVTGTHGWHVARMFGKAWPRRDNVSMWPRAVAFANLRAVPAYPFRHPWHADAAGYPPGKRQHVDAVLRIADFLDRPDRWHDRKLVAPLLSQPVVETCLAIPSWQWVAGGRDRSVARRAFANRLPALIAMRRTKGRLETMCSAAFLRSAPALRDMLLGGRLASEQLLDRAAIEAFFVRGEVDSDFAYYRLMEIADLELWLRRLEDAIG